MENFIVSARKYRPATFASVVGQKHITSTLKNAIERGQLAHAYLFCGPRGVGKTTCARIFAKAINCQRPEGAEACNACESCRSFNENRSLNIHELDAASNNSVDDIRNLIDQVRILPQGGRYSVFIIDEVHMLSAAAFNAFLKTLEEPPAHAIFILATTEKHKILPTILSRCQIYDFNRIKVEDSVEYLRYIAAQEGVGYDEESLNLIAQKADGGMRDALSMFDKAVSFCGTQLEYKSVAQTLNVLDYDTYFNVTDMLLGGDYLSALRLFDAVLAKGFSGQTFMAGLAQHMRDLLVARDAASVSLIELTGTLLERYRAQAGRCTIEFLFGAISLLTEADGRIRQSSNQRLLVELGLMKIAGLGQKKNDGITLDTSYPLPPLTGQGAPAANQTAATGTAAPATPAAAPQPTRPAPAAPAATAPTAAPVPQGPSAAAAPAQPAATPTVAAPAQPAPTAPATPTAGRPAVAAPTARPAASASHATLIGGTSLSSLLSQARRGPATETSAESAEQAQPAVTIDPASGQKLESGRAAILAYIGQERPRLYAFFEQLRIEGHTLRLSVPSEALREEILRNKLEMLTRIAALAGVEGVLELAVEVDEQIRAARPIKLEDRLRHMNERNPLLAELRRELDLEVE
ncbi:DNA polymerase III subunit gamma/tau [Alistipes sp.]|uniref:DNA polymerase III subunit gamma/tau n=1 Tax=Alistipes sp. TaxID=1872444 RepID=UPI003A8C62E6